MGKRGVFRVRAAVNCCVAVHRRRAGKSSPGRHVGGGGSRGIASQGGALSCIRSPLSGLTRRFTRRVCKHGNPLPSRRLMCRCSWPIMALTSYRTLSQESLGKTETTRGESSDSPLLAEDSCSESEGDDMPELISSDLYDEDAGETEPASSASEVREEEPTGESMLHVFAGSPKLGSPEDAATGVRGHVDSVDLLQGGWRHDVRNPDVRRGLFTAVRAKRYSSVWIGMPCSSFTLWRLVRTMTTIRSRRQPEGVDGLPEKEQAYVDLHNALAEFTVELAEAAFAAGCTVVIENPADRGMPGSPLFKWAAREHAPLWLLDCIQRLVASTQARLISFPQCVFGPFQKWTTLYVAGPRAFEFEVLAGLKCTHSSHARVARGRDERGRSNAAASAAYPLGMVALLVWILLRPEEWRIPGVWPRP